MIEKFINKIDKNANIAMYGAGTVAQKIKKYIDENRPDINVKFFIDKAKEGLWCDKPIIKLKDIKNYLNEVDMVVITVRNALHETAYIFEFLGIKYIFTSKPTEYYIRTIPYVEKQKEVQKIFKHNEDKDRYNLIWNTHRKGCYDEIEKYAQEKYGISKHAPIRNYSAQYLEHINKDKIETIVDGGFCNGIQSLAFRRHFKNLKTLYAFEPMYEKFKDDYCDKLIKDENFVQIVPYGLWNEKTTIGFYENTLSKSASRIVGTKEIQEQKRNETLTTINTTTIDDFKKEKNIKKIDFIKMDIEGSEMPALIGAQKTILSDRPQLAISIYHSLSDIVEIPVFVSEQLKKKKYTFYFEHYSYNLFESVLYAIPNELIK